MRSRRTPRRARALSPFPRAKANCASIRTSPCRLSSGGPDRGDTLRPLRQRLGDQKLEHPDQPRLLGRPRERQRAEAPVVLGYLREGRGFRGHQN
jgi:hypothetical protein